MVLQYCLLSVTAVVPMAATEDVKHIKFTEPDLKVLEQLERKEQAANMATSAPTSATRPNF